MRHTVSDVEEERPVLVLVDELNGPLGVPSRQLGLIGVLGDDLVTFDQRQGREFFGWMLRPHVVGVWQPEIIIEAVMSGEKARMMAQVPFSVNGGGVAARLKHLSDGFFLIADSVLRRRTKSSQDSKAIRIT